MVLGAVLSLALVATIGAIWLLASADSPLPVRKRARALERIVVRETRDLDRRIIELTRRMQQFG